MIYHILFWIVRVVLAFWHPVFRVRGRENIPQDRVNIVMHNPRKIIQFSNLHHVQGSCINILHIRMVFLIQRPGLQPILHFAYNGHIQLCPGHA